MSSGGALASWSWPTPHTKVAVWTRSVLRTPTLSESIVHCGHACMSPDVYVYVSCAQTALLDRKDFPAPVITPFEAMLALSRGKEWTGEYVIDFGDLMISSPSPGDVKHIQEARFSFIKGGYMEDVQTHENEDQANEETLALTESSMAALNSINHQSNSILLNGSARSGADF